ncbi:MAG: hypothetical protein KBD48_02295 [Candidatus Pacebacteria bacterium]|nr:hypothetical protein [Candidatus Paceibacterota bacterium]
MKKILQTTKIIIIALIFTVAINWVSAAYIAKPSCVAPSCNTPAMINTGASAQARMGSVAVGTSGTGSGKLYVNGSLSADSMVVSNIAVVTGDMMSNHLYFTPDAFSPSYTSNELCIMTATKQVIKCN